MTGLKAEGLTFRYSQDAPPVIEDFNLEISRGSIVLLTGTSGCGKSTLCSIMAGIYPRHGGFLEKGSVVIDGLNVHEIKISERAKLTGMMFQNPDLQFCMDTVENELVFCLENISVAREDIMPRVEEALNFCTIEHLRKRSLHTLSGGEKQKVMLACIAVLKSSYIILDEPLANIDSRAGKLLCGALQRFREEKGISMMIVDHALSNFIDIADEVIILGERGKILERGINKSNIDAHAEKLKEAGISIPGFPYKKARDENPREGIPRDALREIIFSIEDLSIKFDGNDVLKELSMDFYRGCMTAITGESGSGKSTLLTAISRMTPYRGSIMFKAQDAQGLREASRIPRKGYSKEVGIVFQNPQDQFVANSVYEEIALSLRDKCPKEEMEPRIKNCLEEINLWEYRDFSPYMLSQGQQRRLAVGALLAYECRVLLCDEPTYGQDRRSIEAIMNFLERRVKEDDLTIIFTTHDLLLAESYGDYHYICSEGKLHAKEN